MWRTYYSMTTVGKTVLQSSEIAEQYNTKGVEHVQTIVLFVLTAKIVLTGMSWWNIRI